MTETKKKPISWIESGLYPMLRIKECKIFDLPPPHRKYHPRHQCYIIDFEVIKSEVEGHESGSTVAWASRETLSLGSFLASVLRMPFNSVTSTTTYTVFGTDNPLREMLLRCEVAEQLTRSGRTFTNCKWTPLRLRKTPVDESAETCGVCDEPSHGLAMCEGCNNIMCADCRDDWHGTPEGAVCPSYQNKKTE